MRETENKKFNILKYSSLPGANWGRSVNWSRVHDSVLTRMKKSLDKFTDIRTNELPLFAENRIERELANCEKYRSRHSLFQLQSKDPLM